MSTTVKTLNKVMQYQAKEKLKADKKLQKIKNKVALFDTNAQVDENGNIILETINIQFQTTENRTMSLKEFIQFSKNET